jgi:hypothetical protein
MQAQVANQTKAASKVTLSPRSRWESVPASHKANPSEANPESKQLVPLCIATKASHNSTKGANQTAQAGRIVRLPRSRWESVPASHHASQTKEAPARPLEISHTARTC